jgi:hypothetical protein
VRFFSRFRLLHHVGAGIDKFHQQRVIVQAARSDPPTPRARLAARAKERRLRRWERREQYSEEYRLCKQQGLSPSGMPTGSSSEDEEESDRGRPLREVESPAPVAMGRGGGCGASAHGGRGGTRRQVNSGGARGRRGGAGKHDGGNPEHSRKRKRGFSDLR